MANIMQDPDPRWCPWGPLGSYSCSPTGTRGLLGSVATGEGEKIITSPRVEIRLKQ